MPGNPFTALSAMNERAGQPARLTSRALAMCKPAASSLPAAADLPDPSGNPVPSDMNGHLLVDILTLAFVVVAAVLFLVIKTWLRRKAAAAKSAAESAAAEAACVKVVNTSKLITVHGENSSFRSVYPVRWCALEVQIQA